MTKGGTLVIEAAVLALGMPMVMLSILVDVGVLVAALFAVSVVVVGGVCAVVRKILNRKGSAN